MDDIYTVCGVWGGRLYIYFSRLALWFLVSVPGDSN